MLEDYKHLLEYLNNYLYIRLFSVVYFHCEVICKYCCTRVYMCLFMCIDSST